MLLKRRYGESGKNFLNNATYDLVRLLAEVCKWLRLRFRNTPKKYAKRENEDEVLREIAVEKDSE